MFKPIIILNKTISPGGLALTTSSLIKSVRNCSVILFAALLSACASTPPASTAGSVNFGTYPDNYQEIVTEYLAKKPTRQPLDLTRIQFLNEPNKFIFSQINREKFGYRICAQVPTKNAVELRSHFFLVNDGKVTEHLHDSGLIRLSSQFCNVQMMAIEQREAVIAEKEQLDEHGFKYIVCHGDDQETFYAFSPTKNKLIQKHDANVVAEYDISELSESYIVANGNNGARMSINRISGTMIKHQNNQEATSSCALTSQQKF